jgi:hypothetical protein
MQHLSRYERSVFICAMHSGGWDAILACGALCFYRYASTYFEFRWFEVDKISGTGASPGAVGCMQSNPAFQPFHVRAYQAGCSSIILATCLGHSARTVRGEWALEH